MLKQLIHDAFVALFKAGPFYGCVVNNETGKITIDETLALAPTGISISEINSSFQPAKRLRRAFDQERSSWEWEVRTDFASKTIAFEAFEDAITAGPIDILLPDRSLLAVLSQVEYNPPPQSSPSSGSAAVFTFQILPESLRK